VITKKQSKNVIFSTVLFSIAACVFFWGGILTIISPVFPSINNVFRVYNLVLEFCMFAAALGALKMIEYLSTK
jgi:hypothetical protein